jgi:DNA-binding transcriptional regulator YdaS (Cro superfamily)
MKNNEEKIEQTARYQPEKLLDGLIVRLGVGSSSALARLVGLSPSVISKVRHKRLAVSGEILLAIHEATDIPIRELRRMMGDTRRYFSPLRRSLRA